MSGNSNRNGRRPRRIRVSTWNARTSRRMPSGSCAFRKSRWTPRKTSQLLRTRSPMNWTSRLARTTLTGQPLRIRRRTKRRREPRSSISTTRLMTAIIMTPMRKKWHTSTPRAHLSNRIRIDLVSPVNLLTQIISKRQLVTQNTPILQTISPKPPNKMLIQDNKLINRNITR